MREKILLVENDPVHISSIQRELKLRERYELCIAPDGLLAQLYFQDTRFPVVIINTQIPFANGYQLAEEFRALDPDTHIICLISRDQRKLRISKKEFCRFSYLFKPLNYTRLIDVIDNVFRKRPVVPAGEVTLSCEDLELNLVDKTVRRGNEHINLTEREFLLLKYFLDNKNRVIPREEIAKAVWNLDFDFKTNLIDVYINYLRSKIEKPHFRKLLHTRVGLGYMLKEN